MTCPTWQVITAGTGVMLFLAFKLNKSCWNTREGVLLTAGSKDEQNDSAYRALIVGLWAICRYKPLRPYLASKTGGRRLKWM